MTPERLDRLAADLAAYDAEHGDHRNRTMIGLVDDDVRRTATAERDSLDVERAGEHLTIDQLLAGYSEAADG